MTKCEIIVRTYYVSWRKEGGERNNMWSLINYLKKLHNKNNTRSFLVEKKCKHYYPYLHIFKKA